MKKLIFIQIGILAGTLLVSVGVAQAQTPESSHAEVQALIQKADDGLQTITEAHCREAIHAYEAALKSDPKNYEANWKASRAYCLILDLKTAGLIEEKEEYKPLLKELGEKAEGYAEKAYTVNPKGLDGLVWYNSSYGYHAASLGILKAILKGAGGKLKKLAHELIEVNDTASDALGYRMLGRFYMNAPFPVGSKTKAARYFEKAVQKAPGSLFNHYWLGEIYLEKKQFEQAKKEFQFVLDHPANPDEKHFSKPTQEAARKRLRELASK